MKNIWNLLRQEFYNQRWRAAVLGGVIALVNLISRLGEEAMARLRFGSAGLPNGLHSYQESLGGYLFAAGLIFTSMCFARSMHSKRGQHAWLMLPVHAHEKLAAKVIAYSLAYPAALILFTFLSSLLTEGFCFLFFRHTVPPFNPLDPMIWEMVGHYVVLSSLYLMGASYFKSAHFIKTVLILLASAVVLSLILGLVVRVAYHEHFRAMVEGSFYIDEDIIMAAVDTERWARIGEALGKAIYWAVLTPFFWTVTYFRIREKEAKDAV